MRPRHAPAKVIVAFLPFLIVFVMLFSISAIRAVPLVWRIAVPGFYGIGFLLFMLTRLSLPRIGPQFSSGSEQMAPRNRFLYYTGYLMMILSLFLFLGLLVAVA